MVGIVVLALAACDDDDGGGGYLPPGINPATTGRWYGRILISATSMPRPAPPAMPGFRQIIDHSESWTTTITIDETGKRETKGSWQVHDYQITDYDVDCYHDHVENMTNGTGDVSNENGSYLAVVEDGKGAYQTAERPLPLTANAQLTVQSAGYTTTCSGSTSAFSDNPAPTPLVTALPLHRIAGTLMPDGSANSFLAFSEGGVNYVMYWSLKRDKEIVAKAGSYNVTRAERVTLDPSASRGVINEYEWKVTPGPQCASMGSLNTDQTSSIGTEQTSREKNYAFPVLCPVKAELVVRGPAGEDRDIAWVNVRPREWKTSFERSETQELLDTNSAGQNRCAIGGANDSSHFVHHEGNLGFEDAYTTSSIPEGDGPFGGVFYIASQSLQVKRLEVVNTAYLAPSGRVYTYNVDRGNAEVAEQLAAQARAHERAHSDLLAGWLTRVAGTRQEPARSIERIAAAGEEELQNLANDELFAADRKLCRATGHGFVHARLAANPAFAKSAQIFIPGLPDEPAKALSDFGTDTMPCEE